MLGALIAVDLAAVLAVLAVALVVRYLSVTQHEERRAKAAETHDRGRHVDI